MLSHERDMMFLIVARYQKAVREHGLQPTRTDSELLSRLSGAFQVQPLDLERILASSDLDLVVAIGDVDLHYCEDSRRIKDDFVSKYAIARTVRA